MATTANCFFETPNKKDIGILYIYISIYTYNVTTLNKSSE